MSQEERYPRIVDELLTARAMLDHLLNSPATLSNIAAAGALMAETLARGGKILACGNGGSMCDAMHFAAELTGRFRQTRKPLPAIAICDSAYLSATANDYGYADVFARYISAMSNPGDILLAITTSGNSPNIAQAIRAARSHAVQVVALTGNDGGTIADQADVEIRVPYSPHPERTQELHIKVLHILASLIESRLDREGP